MENKRGKKRLRKHGGNVEKEEEERTGEEQEKVVERTRKQEKVEMEIETQVRGEKE